jgi:hypothetical protein
MPTDGNAADWRYEQDGFDPYKEVRIMARKFFYVCAGMLMLALSYHLGANTAGAQSAQGVQFRVLDADQLYVESGGQDYYLTAQGWVAPSSLPPVPVSSIVAGHAPYITQDGTGWWMDGYQNEWRSYHLPGGPIPAQRESWGQLKARYR